MKREWLIVAIVAIALAVWLGRYDIAPAGNDGVMRLDRFTGSVQQCSGFYDGCVDLDYRI